MLAEGNPWSASSRATRSCGITRAPAVLLGVPRRDERRERLPDARGPELRSQTVVDRAHRAPSMNVDGPIEASRDGMGTTDRVKCAGRHDRLRVMSAEWPRMYRSMLPEASSAPVAPAVGTADNMLGARVPPHPRADIHPDASGNVVPIGGGLSVAPYLGALPPSLVPERLRDKRPGARGTNTLRVFRLGNGSFVRAALGSALELLPTSSKHGVLQPLGPTPIQDYQKELAATRGHWLVDES